ncbi:MAG: RNA-guided pseudouridylation complex pseudouridine synthase subunit Cbf5 [Candidatus Woesearchaeota archaeon]
MDRDKIDRDKIDREEISRDKIDGEKTLKRDKTMDRDKTMNSGKSDEKGLSGFSNKVFKYENCALPFEKKVQRVLLKQEEEPSEKYGCSPEKRSTEKLVQCGIVNIDKPSGPTSHQVSAYVRKILNLNKAGHSGTLDPKVTGVLPVALEGATRIAQELLTAGKEYVCLMKLHSDISKENLDALFSEMTGKIRQLPPVKSAVKRDWRMRSVYYTKILDFNEKDREVLFVIGCQAGTYIRKWVHDLGQKTGGAHMVQLRRTKAGPFNEATLCTLQDLTDAIHYYKNNNDDSYLRKLIMPIEKGVEHLPKIWVFDSTVDSLCHGANLNIPGISKLDSEIAPEDLVAVMTLKNELVCVGTAKESSSNILKNKRGIAVMSGRVFMQPGTYPKMQMKKEK